MRIVTALLACALACPLAGLTSAAAAQDPVPGVESLIDALRGPTQSRGIRLPTPPASPAAPPPSTAPAQPAAPAPPASPALTETTAPSGVAAVALTVTFATGSATLTPAAEGVLRNLGMAMTSPDLAHIRFRVEGHTDTVGAPSQNQSLSERRAQAVRDWLIRRHGIDPRRLEAVGLGEQQLLVQTADDTPEPRNRRVQVLNLGAR